MQNENIAKLYQNTMQGVHCSETFKEELKLKMTNCEPRKQAMSKGYRLAVATAAALMLLLVGTNETVIQAVENFITAGAEYEELPVVGAENITSAFYEAAYFNQTKVAGVADLTQWKETYPAFFAKLEQNQMLDVMLPHYQMDNYAELENAYEYVGELEPGEACVIGTFANGDSNYILTILRKPTASGTGAIYEMEYHYTIEANGISYEVTKVSDDYTYEEYCATFEATMPAWFYGEMMSEEEFAVWMTRPIHIHVMVNGYKYGYSLAEDISVEEFIATIY
ncbi:MAG: hypothetical protein IJ326_11910 [Lachnospiraceae bacterium]|nr:hypothetical protein [Lachnospiraceae bacterium]